MTKSIEFFFDFRSPYSYLAHTQLAGLGAQVILTGTGDAEHLAANVEAIQKGPLPPAVSAHFERIFGRVDSVSGN